MTDSDFTPTTDQVRALYVAATPVHSVSIEQGNAEFDRWLTAHDVEVRDGATKKVVHTGPRTESQLIDDAYWAVADIDVENMSSRELLIWELSQALRERALKESKS